MKNIGLIGCGHISETYFRSREYFNNINITACADLNLEAAKKCANEYNINAMSVDDLLADKNIDVILLGGSFAEGFCYTSDHDIAGNLISDNIQTLKKKIYQKE